MRPTVPVLLAITGRGEGDAPTPSRSKSFVLARAAAVAAVTLAVGALHAGTAGSVATAGATAPAQAPDTAKTTAGATNAAVNATAPATATGSAGTAGPAVTSSGTTGTTTGSGTTGSGKAAGATGTSRSSKKTGAAKTGGTPLTPAEIHQAEQRLSELGYWGGTVDGSWDGRWRQALTAFQKVEWRKRTGILNRKEWNEIQHAVPPAPRETGPPHLEVDLARQVLYWVDQAGKVSRILPISSGSGRPFRAPGWQGVAETPCGHLSVFAKQYGWKTSPLGVMHNPMYVVGGIAIHGSPDVPPKPVSHGCIRIPMYASQTLTKMVPRDTPVLVFGCKDEPPAPSVAPSPR
jgi:lipoprotein-anchoring transpeptidase ErfK/SrfK